MSQDNCLFNLLNPAILFYNKVFSNFSYKFLAFDFNENIEATRENCCLLLIRLKMEGWVVGKSKVFLRYYNVEYLAR